MKAPPFTLISIPRLLTGGYSLKEDLLDRITIRNIVSLLPKPKPVNVDDPDKKSLWKFWRSYNISHPDNPDETYLFRIYVLQTPWFAVMYHEFEKSDHDRHLHDHPFSFVSVLLSGHYTEFTFPDPEIKDGPTVGQRYNKGAILWRPADSTHRIVISQLDKPTTLVFAGPRTREWGFWEDGAWVQWQEYLRRYEK